jgi:hypothetical protein
MFQDIIHERPIKTHIRERIGLSIDQMGFQSSLPAIINSEGINIYTDGLLTGMQKISDPTPNIQYAPLQISGKTRIEVVAAVEQP